MSRQFLRRNLRSVLDRHESELLRQNSDAPHLSKDMIANERRRIGWDYPTTDMLDDLARGHKPVLTIEALQIHPPSNHEHQHSTSQIPPPSRNCGQLSHDGLPDWLPKPNERHGSLQCQIQAKICDVRTPERPLHIDMRNGTLIQRTRNHEGPAFDVKLDSPFAIELNKLFVVTESSARDGPRQWKRTVTQKYLLEISIHCLSSSDTTDLLRTLNPQENASDLCFDEGTFRAIWRNLPEIPAAEERLPLTRLKGSTEFTLEHQVEVIMGWNHPESALVQYNRILQRSQETYQLPTPSASDDMEKPPSKWSVKYNFRDGFSVREATRDSLECIFCNDGNDHPSFSRLLLHYTSLHPYFDYRAGGSEWMTSTGGKVMLFFQEADVSPFAESLRDRNISWVAPRRPLDIVDYLRGEGPWATQTQNKQKSPLKKMGRPPRREPRPDPVRPLGVALPAPRSQRRQIDPSQVPDLPSLKRKRHYVPNVPGVTFYRTTSKQSVQAGEALSESDDDIDEYWLIQRQRRDLLELGETRASREFHELLYLHLDTEKPSADMLIQDSMVRFVRKHAHRFVNQDWKGMLREKLTQMERGRVITPATVRYCLSLPSNGPVTTTAPFKEMKRPVEHLVEPTSCSPAKRIFTDRGRNLVSNSLSSEANTGVIPESPRRSASRNGQADDDDENADPSPSKRRRWFAGRMISEANSGNAEREPTSLHSASNEDQLIPGNHFFHITRPSQNLQGVRKRIVDLLNDQALTLYKSGNILSENVKLGELDYSRFLKIIGEKPFEHAHNVDKVAFVTKDTIEHIASAKDWHMALLQAVHESDLRFELLTNNEFSDRVELMAKRKAQRVGRLALNAARHRNLRQSTSTAMNLDSEATSQVCVCGRTASGFRGTISCAELSCTRTFHILCVGLERRMPDWRCDSCAAEVKDVVMEE